MLRLKQKKWRRKRAPKSSNNYTGQTTLRMDYKIVYNASKSFSPPLCSNKKNHHRVNSTRNKYNFQKQKNKNVAHPIMKISAARVKAKICPLPLDGATKISPNLKDRNHISQQKYIFFTKDDRTNYCLSWAGIGNTQSMVCLPPFLRFWDCFNNTSWSEECFVRSYSRHPNRRGRSRSVGKFPNLK